MADTDQIIVHSEIIDSTVVLRPVGDIDLSCAPALRLHLSRAQGGKPPRLVINLSDVPYMDSSGIATLLEAMQVARRNGTKMILCALREKVRSIVEITRLDTVFTIVESPEAALKA